MDEQRSTFLWWLGWIIIAIVVGGVIYGITKLPAPPSTTTGVVPPATKQ